MIAAYRLAALLLPAVLVLMPAPSGALADDAELRALRRQVFELKNTVRQLQQRIDALEKKDDAPWVPATNAPPPPSASPAASAPNTAGRVAPAAKASVDDKVVTLRKSWRHISTGMTRADVTETLGPPSKETLINGKVVWYYYYAGLGAGSVFFNGDGHTSSSQPPNLGWDF
jgi:SmpA/OmlA family protein